MKKIIQQIACVTLLLAGNAGYAQKEMPPAGSKPKDFNLPGKQTRKLSNGLRATLVQYGSVPKVSISLVVQTGTVHEAPGETGLADLTGRLLQQGSLTTDFKTLSRKVAGMGGTVSVTVGKEEVYISGSVLSEFAPDFIAAIADMLIQPAFPEKELERLKDDMKRELNINKTVPQQIAQAEFRKKLFGSHPYGRLLSTEEEINSFTIGKVRDFYNKNYGARRTSLYLAGVFDAAKVNAVIDRTLGKWKPGPGISTPLLPPPAKGDTLVVNRKEAPQTTVMLGLPVVKPGEPDDIPFSITNSLLGGSFGSRITSNIREDKGYTYSPFSTVQTRKIASVWYEQADVTTEHTVASLQEINKEILKLRDEPPSAEELKGIQNYEAGIFVLQNSNPDGIIGQLQFLDKFGLPDSYLSEKVKKIHAVTPAQVSAMVKKYVDPSKMTYVLVGDEAKIKEQLNKATPKKGF